MNIKTAVLVHEKLTAKKADETTGSKFTFHSRLRSFSYAAQGITVFFKTEANAKIHLALTCFVIIACIYFRISSVELIAISFSIAFVWVAEMFNTAIEKSMDLISLKQHPQIKIIKDIAAGAVLVSAVCASIIGFIVFLPKILML
jgi:diacylglycerol kinase (ATP)